MANFIYSIYVLKIMSGLIRQKDGTYKWELELGKEYYIGTHHGDFAGMNGEDVRAIFLGVINGHRVFIRRAGEDDSKLHSYSGSPDAVARWYSGEEEDVGSPAVQTRYDGKVPDGEIKDFVLRRLDDISQGDAEFSIAVSRKAL